MSEELKIQKIHPYALIPYKANPTDAGFDLFACLDDLAPDAQFVIPKGSRALVPIGIKVAIPHGYYGRVAPRSSWAVKGIDIGAGVIDEGYRGELKVLVINNANGDSIISHGTKIAQLVLEKISTIDKAVLVDSLDETPRGEGGFGSSGA
jgi:dUTP pyrophosphatase